MNDWHTSIAADQANNLRKRYEQAEKGSGEAQRARALLVVYVDASGLSRADYGLRESTHVAAH